MAERNASVSPGEYVCVAPDVKLGKDVKLSRFVNLYGCEIGDETKIGACVEIQKNAFVGSRCKISSHTFICEGVNVEDEVFVGYDAARSGVVFDNTGIEPLVTLRYFGPDTNPLAPAIGDYKKKS